MTGPARHWTAQGPADGLTTAIAPTSDGGPDASVHVARNPGRDDQLCT
jgi:hypothetical protein